MVQGPWNWVHGKFKRGNEQIHYNAREFLRCLDEMSNTPVKKNEKVYLKEKLSINNKINEYIMTRIRTSMGIDLEELKKKFEINLYEKRNVEIDRMVKNMLLKKSNKKIKLTNEGKKIVDHITTKIMI